MPESLTTIAVAVAVFASTNVDDILLLAAFFGQPKASSRSIVVGQFLGIAALTGASVLAALLSLAVPHAWISLLGLAPLALGVRELWKLRTAGDDSEDAPDQGAHSPVIAVALVTMANGGDNLGVYIPLFSKSLGQVPFYLVVFAVMTAVWCILGYWLVRHRVIGHYMSRYGHILLPFVLIGLGLWIIADARELIGF